MEVIIRCTGLGPVEVKGLKDLNEVVQVAFAISKAAGASLQSIEIVKF